MVLLQGANFPFKEKIEEAVEDIGFDINESVSIHSVTPSLINSLRSQSIKARENILLNQEVEKYQYRIGVSDVLMVTVWDHPELTILAGQYRSASESGNWVHADGTIFYPYIGRLRVVNKGSVALKSRRVTYCFL